MITADESAFPSNAVLGLAIRFGLMDQDLFVTKRPLRPTDPVQSIGVFGVMWTPNDRSHEIMGASPGEPTISRYTITIQAFVKDADEERGMTVHSTLSTGIRAILYRDPPLRLLLSSLTTDIFGVRESARRWGVVSQRFLANQLNSEWLYLSTTEMWIETEMETL